MSHKFKFSGRPTTRSVVHWLRRVPSHEAMMLGVPELSGVSGSSTCAGPGKFFWQS
jgi:hypothetical protein